LALITCAGLEFSSPSPFCRSSACRTSLSPSPPFSPENSSFPETPKKFRRGPAPLLLLLGFFERFLFLPSPRYRSFPITSFCSYDPFPTGTELRFPLTSRVKSEPIINSGELRRFNSSPPATFTNSSRLLLDPHRAHSLGILSLIYVRPPFLFPLTALVHLLLYASLFLTPIPLCRVSSRFRLPFL